MTLIEALKSKRRFRKIGDVAWNHPDNIDDTVSWSISEILANYELEPDCPCIKKMRDFLINEGHHAIANYIGVIGCRCNNDFL